VFALRSSRSGTRGSTRSSRRRASSSTEWRDIRIGSPCHPFAEEEAEARIASAEEGSPAAEEDSPAEEGSPAESSPAEGSPEEGIPGRKRRREEEVIGGGSRPLL
jgi:hypothetical protein